MYFHAVSVTNGDEMPVDLPFTPTQKKMLLVLADGLPHPISELQECLYDEKGCSHNVNAHLTAIRKILRLKGEDIICQHINRSHRYRHVRLLHSPGAD